MQLRVWLAPPRPAATHTEVAWLQERVRVCEPPPHVLVHVLHAPHWVYSGFLPEAEQSPPRVCWVPSVWKISWHLPWWCVGWSEVHEHLVGAALCEQVNDGWNFAVKCTTVRPLCMKHFGPAPGAK